MSSEITTKLLKYKYKKHFISVMSIEWDVLITVKILEINANQ